MIPFLFEDLFSTAKSLMSLIIKQDVLTLKRLRGGGGGGGQTDWSN